MHQLGRIPGAASPSAPPSCLTAQAYKVCALFSDHDRGSVGVSADNLRHDRRIYDAKSLHAIDFQLWINDRELIVHAHFARSDGVIDRIDLVSKNLPNVLISAYPTSEQILLLQALERR